MGSREISCAGLLEHVSQEISLYFVMSKWQRRVSSYKQSENKKVNRPFGKAVIDSQVLKKNSLCPFTTTFRALIWQT